MCELHFHRCACGVRWTEAKRLSSCDDPAADAGGGGGGPTRCPDSLCMHVGNPRRPQKKECGPCRALREVLESMEDEEEEEEEEEEKDLAVAAGGGARSGNGTGGRRGLGLGG